MKTTSLFAVLCTASLFSCAKINLPPTISEVNNPDMLTLAIANADAYTNTFEYEYTCTTDTNEVQFSGALNGGQFKIDVFDETGALVYSKTHSTISQSHFKAVAAAGIWRVKIQTMTLTGTLRITVEKKD